MSRFTPAKSVRNIRQAVGLFQNRRTMMQMIREALKGRYKLSFVSMMLLVVIMVYVIFPFDILPDYIPFIGWVDDGIAFYLALKVLNKETQRFIRYKAMERRGGSC